MKKSHLSVGAACLIAIVVPGCATLTESAQKGDAASQVKLSEKLFTGQDGYPQDSVNAKKWIDLAIKSNYMPARVKKSDFILSGYYGNKINCSEAVTLLYPAVQSKNPQAALNLLKILIKYKDTEHLDIAADCFALLVDRKYTSRAMTSEMLTFVYENCTPFMENALQIEHLSLAQQKQRVFEVSKFANVGFSWTRKRLKYRFVEAIKKIKNIEKKLERTREIKGEGISPVYCRQDALAKAIQELCGISVETKSIKNREEISVTLTEQKANKETNRGFSKENDSFVSQNVEQYLGKLESFIEISAPKKRPDGMFEGKYKAVRK